MEELRDAEEDLREEGQVAAHVSPVVLALNNLSVAYLRQRDFLRARFWVQMAIGYDPKSPAAIHNRSNIDRGLRAFVWPASPNGTYVLYAGCGFWNEIRISEASASAVKIAFNGIRVGALTCHREPAALGVLEGEAVRRAKSALYGGDGEYASCKIQLQFQADSVSVEDNGDCGFGMGVHAGGVYQRISVRWR